MNLLKKGFVIVGVALTLTGCFAGSKQSYPHAETTRVTPFAVGNYEVTDLANKNKRSSIGVGLNPDKTYRIVEDDEVREIGFYYNETSA